MGRLISNLLLVCSILSAPTAEDQKVVKEASGGFQVKLRRMSTAAFKGINKVVQGFVPTQSTKSRLASIKSSFFLNQEAIKLSTPIVQSHTLALAAVRTVGKWNGTQQKTMGVLSGLPFEVDSAAPIFQFNRQPERSKGGDEEYTITRFMRDFALQREAITDEANRDRFDMVWG